MLRLFQTTRDVIYVGVTDHWLLLVFLFMLSADATGSSGWCQAMVAGGF